MNAVNRGSEWNKWDLHYHVFGTHLNNQFGDDENGYLAEIENSDILAFGITDYWTASKQLETIKKFKDKYPTSNKNFFVNVEFRLNQNVSSIPTGHVNVHLIFDNKLKPETIISFIDSLELTSTHSNGTKTRISELENQSEYECASISLDEIMRNLKKHFGTDKPYLLGFAAGGLGGIRPLYQRK
ncbi:hypothetical protein [Pediococcus pentosaceus]|uniref:hypothetical protein n=1 Tax=Pediococcus pentosaceus TaxID=1255 RepID=UPI003D8088C8